MGRVAGYGWARVADALYLADPGRGFLADTNWRLAPVDSSLQDARFMGDPVADNARYWLLAATLTYLLAVGLAVLRLLRGRPPQAAWVLPWVVGGWLLQAVGLHSRGLVHMACPILNPFEVLNFISFSLVVLFLVTGTVFRTTLLGGLTAALAAGLGLMAQLVPQWDLPPRINSFFGGNPWIETHASLALFSYGAFGLLSLTSLMYLLQHRALRRKQARPIYRILPSVVQLETVNLRLLLVGMVCFSISLAIGTVVYTREPEAISGVKFAVTLNLWVLGLALLGLRLGGKVRGPRFSWAAIGFFLAALLALWPVEQSRQVNPAPERAPETVPTHGP